MTEAHPAAEPLRLYPLDQPPNDAVDEATMARFDRWLYSNLTAPRLRHQAARRLQETQRQGFVPATVFSLPLNHARNAYVFGQFSAAILTMQAVCEGIAKRAAERLALAEQFWTDERETANGTRQAHARARVQAIRDQLGPEGAQVCDALARIHAASRNDLVHMNRCAPTEHAELERLAGQCVRDLLCVVEPFFFGVTFTPAAPGCPVLLRPQFWDVSQDGTLSVQLDCTDA